MSLGVETPRLALSPATPIGLARAAIAAGVPLVATSENYHPAAGDRELYRVVARDVVSATYPMHILDDDEWRRAVARIADGATCDRAIANRDLILDRCRAELRPAALFSPPRTRTLRALCLDGAARTGTDLTDPVYAERLDRELRLIEEKEFEDYFHLLADVVGWARTKMIVGPARGSSCGSLVCYLLDVTTIDPIPHDLVFERFIDSTRNDLPDVDVDFSDRRRSFVFDYMEVKFGRDRIARLGSVGTYQPRSAMAAVAAALRIPDSELEEVTNVIIKRSAGDNRASAKLEDTFRDTEPGRKLINRHPLMAMATRLEDHPTNAGQHAAGVVVTRDPVVDVVAVDGRNGATMCDKYDAEEINLLKVDALGLTQLSIFERVLELIGKASTSASRFLEAIPLDDPAAFAVLNERRYAGIFQFTTGSALAAITTDLLELKPGAIAKFDDVAAMTALVRPGPLSSGGTRTWMMRMVGRETVVHFHPIFEPYLRDTFGIAVYQEQVMRICREVGDLSWEDVNKLRRAMSKSFGKEYFDQFGDRFKAAATGKGVPAEAVGRMWDHLCTFGAMGFNKAHSVAYAMVSYWSCWLKARHPVEYAAAALDAEPEPAGQIVLLRELAREGVGYVAVDPERSTDRWEVVSRAGGRLLIGPLSNVRGIGPKKIATIMAARMAGTALPPGIAKLLGAGRTEISSLTPIADAISGFPLPQVPLRDKRGERVRDEDGKIVFDPVQPERLSLGQIRCGYKKPFITVGVLKSINPKDLNAPVSLARRGGRLLTGPTLALNMSIRDDDDQILCHIGRDKYSVYGRKVIERGGIGKAIYAIFGRVTDDFRVLIVDRLNYLGQLP
jgi:DNA-directed DNA polymerase III PolC